jgi:hypothetical protein
MEVRFAKLLVDDQVQFSKVDGLVLGEDGHKGKVVSLDGSEV